MNKWHQATLITHLLNQELYWPVWVCACRAIAGHRFSAFWLRSKCSICSYQLNIWYVAQCHYDIKLIFGLGRSVRGLLHLCHGLARYCSTSGIGPPPLSQNEMNESQRTSCIAPCTSLHHAAFLSCPWSHNLPCWWIRKSGPYFCSVHWTSPRIKKKKLLLPLLLNLETVPRNRFHFLVAAWISHLELQH